MKVFISYAAADEALARKVSDTLKKAGMEVWDGTEISPGENWAAKVGEALQESQAMVVLLTPASLGSSNVMYEIGYALGNKDFNKRLIPVLAASPEQLPRERIPWILRNFQMITLSKNERDEEIDEIAQVILEAA